MARILVADDDPSARYLVRVLLEREGHEVTEAADGLRARDEALAQPPDLAILDLALPQLDGAQVIRALRADPRTRDLRIALYTATRADAALALLVRSYGLVALLPKPSEPEELAAAVARALAPREP
jgi:CheY-like chemotaxis protein